MRSETHKGGKLEAARTFRATPSDTDEAIFHYLTALDSPRALTVWLLYRSGEHDQLTELGIEPSNYRDAWSFRLAYCATHFLSKAEFLRTSFNRKEVALEKFEKFESLCGETNRRFQNPSLDPLNHGSNVWLLNATRRKITEILGDYSAEEFVDQAGWGPGVSTLVKGEEVSAFNKFHAERGITRDLYALVSPWFPQAYPTWAATISAHSEHEGGFLMQVGNSIVTVPKNSKTDRVIAVEPGINLWFQKAIGSMIRRRLRRAGVDLNTQEKNQYLAKTGSQDSGLATIDFSSASDSIATEVVRELLPPTWFQLLDVSRSKIGTAKTGNRRWNKFSSMGNGFTFELESLIFYAAALAVQEYTGVSSVVSVFGDDVIISEKAVPLYSEFCAFLGFRVNHDKSFWTGPFRESCGSHYYSGVDCKPVFLKKRLQNVESFYKLANNVRNLSHRFSFHLCCDKRFLACWNHLRSRVPELLQLWVPRTAGDVGFQVNFDEARPARARNGIEGFYYTALTSRAIRRESDHYAMCITRVWQAGSEALEFKRGLTIRDLARKFLNSQQSDLMYGNNYTLRGRSKRAISRSLVAQWYNFGEWCY